MRGVSKKMVKKAIAVLSWHMPEITIESHADSGTAHLSDLVSSGIPNFASLLSEFSVSYLVIKFTMQHITHISCH
jgi:hypothetical protein